MTQARKVGSLTSPAFRFVMTTGVVNLFGDITYEGGQHQQTVHGDVGRQRRHRQHHGGARRVSRLRSAFARRLRSGPDWALLANNVHRLRHQRLRGAGHGARWKLAGRGRARPRRADRASAAQAHRRGDALQHDGRTRQGLGVRAEHLARRDRCDPRSAHHRAGVPAEWGLPDRVCLPDDLGRDGARRVGGRPGELPVAVAP